MSARTHWLRFVLVALVGFSTGVKAAVIWSEDFSNVSDWQVINDPGGGSAVTSDGNLGSFHVPSAANEAAFGPIPGTAPLVSFDTLNKSNYFMAFTVFDLTGSTSYDLRLDEFDAGTNYLSTIFGVFPQGTFTGSTNLSLGAFSYNAGTAFVLPKITVFTGNADQTVRFDSMDFTVVPEPTTVLLVLLGASLLGIRSRLFRRLLSLAVVGLAFAGSVRAAIIWSEDFSDVSDWQVIAQSPGAGASITSDGNLGLFHVTAANSDAAFGPTPFVAPLVTFNPGYAAKYSLGFTVPSLTDSTSYDIRLDEFDANTNYLSTVFGVLSQGTFTGTTNILLGVFSYNPSTVFVLPKVTVFTGNGDQTVRFDSMEFTAVPEPSTMMLFVAGLGLIWRWRNRVSKHSKP